MPAILSEQRTAWTWSLPSRDDRRQTGGIDGPEPTDRVGTAGHGHLPQRASRLTVDISHPHSPRISSMQCPILPLHARGLSGAGPLPRGNEASAFTASIRYASRHRQVKCATAAFPPVAPSALPRRIRNALTCVRTFMPVNSATVWSGFRERLVCNTEARLQSATRQQNRCRTTPSTGP